MSSDETSDNELSESSVSFVHLRNILIEKQGSKRTKQNRKQTNPKKELSKVIQNFPSSSIKSEPISPETEINNNQTQLSSLLQQKSQIQSPVPVSEITIQSSHDKILQTEHIIDKIEITMATLDPKFVLKLVPNFSGNSRDLHKFITACELIYSGLREQDRTQFLQLIKLKLDGKAYNLVKYKTLNTWDEFKKLIEREFTETRSIGHLQMELTCIRQGRNEDVKSFSTRLETLLHDLNEACINSQDVGAADTIKSLNSNIALKSFQEGLDPTIKLIVKACRFDKLSDAINRAIEEELTVKHMSKFSVTEKTQSSIKSAYCNYCKRTGHTKDTCYRKPNSTYNSKTVNSISSQQCAYCKKFGHHIQDCFSKKRRDTFNINHNTEQPTATGSGNVRGFSKPERGTPSRIRDLHSVSQIIPNQTENNA